MKHNLGIVCHVHKHTDVLRSNMLVVTSDIVYMDEIVNTHCDRMQCSICYLTSGFGKESCVCLSLYC